MKAKQLYFVLLGTLVMLLAGFLAVAYGANKLMSSQAVRLSHLRADSAALDNLESSLAKNKRDIVTYSELNNIARTIVPQDKDQAKAVREIVNLAAQSGIDKLSGITFPTSTLGSPVVGASANPDLTQVIPVDGINGVYQLQITITQNSTDAVQYDQFITFLSKLEQNRRTAQVSSINIQPNTDGPSRVSFVLVINEFIKP